MYMSPEIATGDPNLDERSDIFALGVILFEMLTLQSFVDGEDIIEIKEKILNKPYPLPREVAPNRQIPRDLQALCMKALQRKKSKRYPNILQLLDDLQKFRHGEEVSVYWYSGWEKLTRWNHRNAYLILSFTSALVGAGIYALFTK